MAMAKGPEETLHVAELDSPVGRLRLASSSRGLAYLELPRASGRGLRGWAARFAPGSELREGFAPNRTAARQIQEFLEGKRRRFELPLDLRATDFQHLVYAAVSEVPYGETTTYGEIADRIARPSAVRAVGAAIGANPLPLVIPCHRIVAAGGHLQGYAGGLELKARLLAVECGSVAPGPDRLL